MSALFIAALILLILLGKLAFLPRLLRRLIFIFVVGSWLVVAALIGWTIHSLTKAAVSTLDLAPSPKLSVAQVAILRRDLFKIDRTNWVQVVAYPLFRSEIERRRILTGFAMLAYDWTGEDYALWMKAYERDPAAEEKLKAVFNERLKPTSSKPSQ